MRVHAIQTGRVQIKASQIVGRGHGLKRRLAPLIDAEWSSWLPVFAYAIEHRDGVILVDAGASVGLKRLPRWHPYFRLSVRFDIEPEQEAGPQLRAIGIGAADVKRIVLTHLHIDHDGGLAAFPKSEVLVSPGELAAASGLAGRLRGYLPNRWPKNFDPNPLVLGDGPYGPFQRSKRLAADGAIVAVATPGHTADHLSVIVEDGDADIVIAGDASYNEATMLAGTIDGVSGDEAAAFTSLGAIQAFAAARPMIYLPAHDPESAQRLATRRTTQRRQPGVQTFAFEAGRHAELANGRLRRN
jgi:N-acyl homoserine lactone hydrolase